MPVIRREIHEQETTPDGNIVDRTIFEYEYLAEEKEAIIDELNEVSDSETEYDCDSDIEECAGTTCEDEECCPQEIKLDSA